MDGGEVYTRGQSGEGDKSGKETFHGITFFLLHLKTIKADCCGWAHLNARGDAVDNPDGFAVWMARQGVGDEVVLHLPWRLCACLHPINSLTGWTLQTPILRGQGQSSKIGEQFG